MPSPSPPRPSYWCYSCHHIVCLPLSDRLVCPLCGFDFLEELGEINAPGIVVIGGSGRPSRSNATRDGGFWQRLFGVRRRAHELDGPSFHMLEIASLSGTDAPVGLSGRGPSGILREGDARGSDDSDNASHVNGLIEGSDVPASLVEAAATASDTDNGNANGALTEGRALAVRDNMWLTSSFNGMQAMFLGPSPNFFMQQFAGDEGGRCGSLPASKAVIEAMPTMKITEQMLEMGEINCAVCKEDFNVGGEVREMPCKHLYHSPCILPWLTLHSSCPLCRYELPREEYSESETHAAENEAQPPHLDGGAGNSRERGLVIFSILGGGDHMLSVVLVVVGNDRESAQRNQEVARSDGPAEGSTTAQQDQEGADSDGPVEAATEGSGAEATVEAGSDAMSMVIRFGSNGRESNGLSSDNSDLRVAVSTVILTEGGPVPASSSSETSFRRRLLSWLRRYINPFRETVSRVPHNG